MVMKHSAAMSEACHQGLLTVLLSSEAGDPFASQRVGGLGHVRVERKTVPIFRRRCGSKQTEIRRVCRSAPKHQQRNKQKRVGRMPEFYCTFLHCTLTIRHNYLNNNFNIRNLLKLISSIQIEQN